MALSGKTFVVKNIEKYGGGGGKEGFVCTLWGRGSTVYPIFILGETREQIVSLLGTENNI